MSVTVLTGDCLDLMAAMPEASVEAVVTDPPYGIGFMGKKWDTPGALVEREADRSQRWDRVGGNHNPANSADAARTQKAEGRKFQAWCEGWASEALRVLKPGGHLLAMGHTRTFHRLACGVEEAGFEIRDAVAWLHGQGMPKNALVALKPALELITLARKPLEGTIAANVEAHGTGTLNIEGCRGVGRRWPANVCLDGSDEVLAAFPESVSGSRAAGARKGMGFHGAEGDGGPAIEASEGSAARFFYCAKPSRVERGFSNTHPTVKPIALMRWLVRLVTPPGGLVLDPFGGSGTTGIAAVLEGMSAVLCEVRPDCAEMARNRIVNQLGLFAQEAAE